jgi:K+-sensing histidine kinase KdpD
MDGFIFRQPRRCRKCHDTSCWDYTTDVTDHAPHHFGCPKGISLVVFPFPDGPLLCNGIIVEELNRHCPSRVKKDNQEQLVSWEVAKSWHRAVNSFEPMLAHVADAKTREAILGLHDVKTAVSLITRNAEALIRTLPGETDDERIECAAPPLKSLLKSVELLHARLAMSSIAANPEAASHGRQHPTPIYRVFHRMVRLFEEIAHSSGKLIRMDGSSFSSPMAFDSFDVLAIVLVDNAVKYCDRNGQVVVAAQDVTDGVEVSVSNPGVLVPNQERERIFNKGYRAGPAAGLASSGSGLGLYIANLIAQAHGFKIRYDGSPNPSNGKAGINTFSFVVPAG